MSRDWTQFTRRITVSRKPQEIYNAWAIPSQIERWFLRTAEYAGFDGKPKDRSFGVEAGDEYLWRWHGYLDDVSETGSVIEANGRDRFAFTFTADCLVTVAVKIENGETIVELTQSRIPDEPDHGIYIDCGYGWAFYLANLKSVLEDGVDLRNMNVEVGNVINS